MCEIKTKLYQILKTGFNDNLTISVYSYDFCVGKLSSLTYKDIGDDKIIDLLMKWRIENYDAYPSQFDVSFEGTRRWLTKFILDKEDKILFLLVNQNGKYIGHMGMANIDFGSKIVEMDNIVRGEKEGAKGIITLALYDLISWNFNNFNLDKVYLRVFSDNTRAIKLYNDLRFIEVKKIPLIKTINDNGEIKFVDLDKDNGNADRYFSYMELSRNDHFENYLKIKSR